MHKGRLDLAPLRGAVFFCYVFRWCRSLARPQPPANIWQASGLPLALGSVWQASGLPLAFDSMWQASGLPLALDSMWQASGLHLPA
jgi:hypothetical protein